VARVRRYGDLTAVMPECEYNFCDIARTLGENTFRRPCNFKELRAVKRAHITTLRYVPDGSLCTASAEQILPRDSIQRNCLKLALYTTRDHDCISNRIGGGIRNIRDADVGSLRSVRSQRRRRYIARDPRGGYAGGSAPSATKRNLSSAVPCGQSGIRS